MALRLAAAFAVLALCSQASYAQEEAQLQAGSAIEVYRVEIEAARKRLETARRQNKALADAYAGVEDAEEPPSKYQALALMRNLEDQSAAADHRKALDGIRQAQARCADSLDRVERDLASAGTDADRGALEAQRHQLRTLEKLLRGLVLVLEGEREALTDTLFLLRRENMFLRGRSELSWSALGRGVRDVGELPGWLAGSAEGIGAYFADAARTDALLRYGGLAVLSALILVLLFRFLGGRARRRVAAEQGGVRARALATLYLLLRDLAVAAYLFLLFYGAAEFLPGLSVGVAALLRSLGQIFGGLWLLRAVLRELLSPAARERMPLGLESAPANALWRAARLLILVSAILLPVLRAMEMLGYPNLGAREALWLCYRLTIGLVLFALLLRRKLWHDLVPETKSLGARIYHGAVKVLRPLAALLVPVVVVLGALRFDLLVRTITRTTVALVGAVVLTVFLHRLVAGAVAARITKTFPEDGVPEIAGRREAALAGTRFLLFLLTAYAAVWGFLTMSGSSPEGLRRMLESPLPLVGQSAAQVVTWWNLLVAIVVLVVFFKGTRPAKLVLREFVLSRTSIEKGLQYTINTLFGYVLLASGVLLAANQVVDLSTLGYIAAALSIGIGFGLQEIVSNFVSGLILLFERPLKVGDTVEVGDSRGTVRHISIRATTVQTLDNIVLLVPNREFITQAVVNYSHHDSKIRLHIGVGVSYGSDTALIKKVLLEVAAAHPRVRKHPAPDVQFVAFGDSSLDFELLAWITDPAERSRIRSELRFAIFGAFADHGITIPFPQRDLHVRSAEGLKAPEASPEEP